MADKDLILSQNIIASGVEYEAKTVNIAKGGLLSADSLQEPTVLTGGINGYVLVRDDTPDTGLAWKDPNEIASYPLNVARGGTGQSSLDDTHMLVGNGTNAIEVAAGLRYGNTPPTIFLSTSSSSTTSLKIKPGNPNAYIYNWDTDDNLKGLILGGYSNGTGISIDPNDKLFGIFKDSPISTLHVGGSARIDSDLYLDKIAPVQTSLVTIDTSGKLGTTTLAGDNQHADKMWAGNAVYNAADNYTKIAHYDITNAEYDALVGSCIKLTLGVYRTTNRGIGSGSFNIYISKGSTPPDYRPYYLMHFDIDADYDNLHIILEAWIYPLNSTYTRTIAKYTDSEGNAFTRVNYVTDTYNGTAEHGDNDDIVIIWLDSEDDAVVTTKSFMVETITT